MPLGLEIKNIVKGGKLSTRITVTTSTYDKGDRFAIGGPNLLDIDARLALGCLIPTIACAIFGLIMFASR